MKSRKRHQVRPLVGVLLERAISNADEVYPWIIALGQQRWPIVDTGYGRTDVSRCTMVENMLTSDIDYTHLVMLDIDHDHGQDVVPKLIRAVTEDPSRLVVTALSFRRGQPYEPIAFRRNDEGLFQAVLTWEPGEVLGGLARIGLGAVIIAKEVFERVPWPWFKYEYLNRGEYPSEDIWFAKQCEAAGIGMYVDTRITNDHLSVARVNESVFWGYIKMREDQERQRQARGEVDNGA